MLFASVGREFVGQAVTERLPTNLLQPLADLGRWLDAVHAQAVVVGGVAVSFLGRPRFTQDIDALAILSETAAATAMSDLIEDFDKLLARRKLEP